MPGERSRRTLADCERPGKRVELDRRRRLAGGRSKARPGRTQEMEARELAAGRPVFSVTAGRRYGLVECKQPAPAPAVFPHCCAVSCERPGSVARRTNAGDGRLFRAGEQLRALDI